MHTNLGHNVYEYGHIFPLIISTAALVLLLVNRTNLKSYRQYRNYLACLASLLLASALYVISVILNVSELHTVAGLGETAAIIAIVFAVRNERPEDDPYV